MKLNRRLAAATLSAAFVATATFPALQQSAAANDCPLVEIVAVPGTGASRPDDDPNVLREDQFKFVKDLVDRYPGQVRAWQVPYPASLGIAHSVQQPNEPVHLPYGASVQEGVNKGVQHIQEVKAACPATKFIVTGFSQGASTAGDITAAITNNQVPGVSAEDLEAAYLIADPGRTVVTNEQVTTHSGGVGLRSVGGEVLIPADQNTTWDTVGLTGPRPDGTFAAADRRVMTFCVEHDLACSTEQDGFFMTVGKGMYDWKEPAPAHYGPGLSFDEAKQGFGGFLALVLLAVENGDENGVRLWTNIAAGNGLNTLPQEKKDAMRELGNELALVARAKATNPSVPKYTGPLVADNTPPLLRLLFPQGIGPQNTWIGRTSQHVMNTMPIHLSYFEQGSPLQPWTIDGKPVDRWIYDDAVVRVDWWVTHS